MKKCHKRWKKEQKEKRLKNKQISELSEKRLNELMYFMDKHPDQAVYEMNAHKEGRRSAME